MRIRACFLALGFATLCVNASSFAYTIGGGRFDVRLRAYTQAGVMTESSETTGCVPVYTTLAPNGSPLPAGQRRLLFTKDPRRCPPEYSAGDFGQHRNFYNPEFDAKLTDFVRWGNDLPGGTWVTPDDFKFRFAWWGFYDGLYDYLDGPWNDHRRNPNQDLHPGPGNQIGVTRFSQSNNIRGESYVFNHENKNPRHIYASRNRINELYLDYTKGPVFVRAGRQAISWGEADTIALLDVSNPFDLTLAAPGLFEDVDESRIPLWTLRTTVQLVDSWRFLSNGFIDTYLVPGPIDTTVPINPITYGQSPFAPDVPNPQANLFIGPTTDQIGNQAPFLHTVVVDRLPENTWANSRWGVRLAGIFFKDYTVQAWFFRTFNQAPQPVLSSISAFDSGSKGNLTLVDDRGFRTPVCIGASGARIPKKNPDGSNNFGVLGRTPAGRACSWKSPVVTTLDRQLENVAGLASTWFSQPLNGIIRTEIEWFIDELAFLPQQNLNPRTQIPQGFRPKNEQNLANSAAKADYLRWVLGYDRFFFFRPLNPTNSFILSASYNSSFNLSERQGKDYRNAQAKPGRLQAESGPIAYNASCKGQASFNNPLCVRADPKAFEDAYRYEAFLQTALQTDYMHGALSPRLVIITDVNGTFSFLPSLIYRVNDNFLLSGQYIAIAASRKSGAATFRGHDMVQVRATFQLN